MPIRMENYAGRFGWNARKYFPRLASEAYLKMQFLTRRKIQKEYIDYFLSCGKAPLPHVVNIETVNRCNSTCEFCTANKNAEKRPFAKMTDELYYRIIDQLRDWGYEGHLTLYGNNEPLLDPRIVDFHRYARQQLPNCFIFMSTNGLILTLDKVRELMPYLNQLIINNYCLDMKLHPNIQEIYDYVKTHPEEFAGLDILIQMRYLKEVLTNRAGSAPNKPNTEKVIRETCLMPYTDLWITPNGQLGICCCDNLEVTNFGNCNEISLEEAWNGKLYRTLREKMRDGRQNWPFCRYCDFIDTRLRTDIAKEALQKAGR